MLEKQTCKHCKLYHSTIEAKKMHQQKCQAEINQDVEEETNGEEEDEPEQPPNAEKENNDDSIMDRVNIFKRIDGFFGVQCKYGVHMV